MKTYIMTKAAIPVAVLVAWLLAPQTAHCFYNPSTGRWISRDPTEEKGGINLYVFVSNCPNGNLDGLGDETIRSGDITGDIRHGLNLAFKIDKKMYVGWLGIHPYSYLQMVLWFGSFGNGPASHYGEYDFKSKDAENKNEYYIGGRKVRNDQMGNYLAGYAAGYAMMETGDPMFWLGVQGAGIGYAWQESGGGKYRSSLGWFLGDDWGSVVMMRSGALDGAVDSLFQDDE
jgi:hypothetical protein